MAATEILEKVDNSSRGNARRDNTATARHSADYVTLVHLTDLHFGLPRRESDIRFNTDLLPDEQGERPIVAEIRRHNPDVVCVTGDIVDNASRALGLDKFDRRSREFISTVEDLEQAKATLEAICRPNVEGGVTPLLCVIPGNHDYRVQGYLGPSWKILALKKSFDRIFDQYLCRTEVGRLFKHPNGSKITVRILGVDSNHRENSLSAATGHLTDEELKVIPETFTRGTSSALVDSSVTRVADPSEFRVVLVHHHPLPVTGAEKKPRDPAKGFKGLLIKLRGYIDTVTGEQGSVFLRAGGFVAAARTARVDLVLHGHQHYPQITVLREPRLGDPDHPLMIVGGGSLGELTENEFRYNVIRLYRNGNVKTFDVSREPNSTYLSLKPSKPTAELYRDEGYRYQQANWMLFNLRNSKPAATQKFGVARASQCVRRIAIRHDGSADYEIELWGLAAVGDDVGSIPIITPPLAHCVMDCPTIVPLHNAIGDNNQVTIVRCDAQEETGEVVGADTPWMLVFNPPLTKGSSIAYKVKYTIHNNIDFVTEFARQRTPQRAAEGEYEPPSNHEYTSYQSIRVRMDRLIIAVTFPTNFQPTNPARLVVLDDENKRDLSEEAYTRKSLFASDTIPRTVSLTINTPLPGYDYRIEWELSARREFEAAAYDEGALELTRAHEHTDIDDQTFVDRVNHLRAVLRTHYLNLDDEAVARGERSLPDDVSLTIFFTRTETQKKHGETFEVAYVQSLPYRPDGFGQRWGAGEGVVGKAHRLGHDHYVPRTDAGGGYHQRGLPHSAVWAIPLRVPVPLKNERPSPIFAILCIDSRKDMSGYRELNYYAANFAANTDELARSLSDSLIAQRQRPRRE